MPVSANDQKTCDELREISSWFSHCRGEILFYFYWLSDAYQVTELWLHVSCLYAIINTAKPSRTRPAALDKP